jgi:hypothetical protein
MNILLGALQREQYDSTAETDCELVKYRQFQLIKNYISGGQLFDNSVVNLLYLFQYS